MQKLTNEMLSVLGMSPMQGKVYIAALELGEAGMQALSRKAGVNRSTIYTFIEDLKSRGYIQETKRGRRRVYSAAHPDLLLEKEKGRVAELERMLPELVAINNRSKHKPKVTFYEGLEGIETVYNDMLRDKKEIVAYEDLDNLKEGLSGKTFEWFPKERAKRDILIRSISRDTPLAREFSKRNIGLLRETKFLKTKEFRTDINIYGNKVALMDLRGTPFAVLIENKDIAETLRTVWKELWDRLED